jgi:phage baseplate assembly protein gpV
MPYGDYDGCFVLCSGFAVTDKAQKDAFMEDGKEKSRKRVYPGNLKEEYDCATGTHEIISPDGKTSLKIDYGTEGEAKDPPELHLKLFDNIKADIVSDESLTLSAFDDEVKIEHTKGGNAKVAIFDTELTIKNGEVSVKSPKTAIEVDGDVKITAAGKTDIEASGNTTVKGQNVNVEAAAKVTVKAPQVQITGGQLQVNGTAAPAAGPFCGLPNCLFTGAPHGGNMVNGT